MHPHRKPCHRNPVIMVNQAIPDTHSSREKYLDPPIPFARGRIVRAILPLIRDQRLSHAPPDDRRVAGFDDFVCDQPMPHGCRESCVL